MVGHWRRRRAGNHIPNHVPFVGLGLEDVDTCFFPRTDRYRRTALHIFSENDRSSFTSTRVRSVHEFKSDNSQSCSISVELRDDVWDQLLRCVSEVAHCIFNGRETSQSADHSDEDLN